MAVEKLFFLVIFFSYQHCGLAETEVLTFDVIRSRSIKTPLHPACATLYCSITTAAQEFIHLAISLDLFMSSADLDWEHIASVYASNYTNHNRAYVSQSTGTLARRHGYLTTVLKDNIENCSSLIFTCRLQFINIKTMNITASTLVKQPKTSRSGGSGPPEIPGLNLENSRLQELKTFISDQVAQVSEKSEAMIRHVQATMENVGRRMSSLEESMDSLVQERLGAIEKKLDEMNQTLNEDPVIRLAHLSEKLDNVRDSVVLAVDNTYDLLEAKVDQTAEMLKGINETMNLLLNRSQTSSAFFPQSCEDFQTNISTLILNGQQSVSSLRSEVLSSLTDLQKPFENTESFGSMRHFVGALLKLSHNVSEIKSELQRLSVQNNLQADMGWFRNKMDLLTEFVKTRLDKLDLTLDQKFQDIHKSWKAVKEGDKDIQGKLSNLEINLQDVRVVIKSLKSVWSFF